MVPGMAAWEGRPTQKPPAYAYRPATSAAGESIFHSIALSFGSTVTSSPDVAKSRYLLWIAVYGSTAVCVSPPR